METITNLTDFVDMLKLDVFSSIVRFDILDNSYKLYDDVPYIMEVAILCSSETITRLNQLLKDNTDNYNRYYKKEGILSRYFVLVFFI